MTWQYKKFSFGSEGPQFPGSTLRYSGLNTDRVFGLYIFFLKRAFVDVPGTKWSVIASNTRTEFAPIGSPNPDLWIGTEQLYGLGNQWCLIQRTSGEQILISGGGGSTSNVMLSLSGAFAGGTANTVPSAPDEVRLLRYIDGRFFELASIHVFWKSDGTSHRIFIKDEHLTHGIIACEKLVQEPGSEELNDMVFMCTSSSLGTSSAADPISSSDMHSFEGEHVASFPRVFYITRSQYGGILPLVNLITVNLNDDRHVVYSDSTRSYDENVSPYSYEESKYGILLVEPLRLVYRDGAKFQSVGKMTECFLGPSNIARNNKIKVSKGIIDEYYYFFGSFGQLVDENLVLGES